MTIERNGIRIVLRSMRSKGYNQKHILLVGYSSAAEGFIDRVNKNPEWGYTIRGIIDDTKERGSEYKGVKVIGCIEDLDYILEQNSLDEIAVTLSLSEYEKLRHIVALVWKRSLHSVKNPACTRSLSRITGTLSRRSRIWKISRACR